MKRPRAKVDQLRGDGMGKDCRNGGDAKCLNFRYSLYSQILVEDSVLATPLFGVWMMRRTIKEDKKKIIEGEEKEEDDIFDDEQRTQEGSCNQMNQNLRRLSRTRKKDLDLAAWRQLVT